MTGLVHGITYTFVVTALNGSEPGAVSAASNARDAFRPARPTGRRGRGGDGLATVSFSPPASSGDSAIDYYTVTASPGGKSAIGTASPITVSGPRQRHGVHLHGDGDERALDRASVAPVERGRAEAPDRTAVASAGGDAQDRDSRRRARRPARGAAASSLTRLAAEVRFGRCRPPPLSPSSAPPRWR